MTAPNVRPLTKPRCTAIVAISAGTTTMSPAAASSLQFEVSVPTKEYTATGANQISSLSNDYRGEPFPRPNVSGNGASQSKSQELNTFFAGYIFSTPAANVEFGDLGRNAFRAPGFWQWDNNINKTFRIGETVAVQFRSEFFNILNRTNLGVPDTKTSDAAFGTIRTTYPSRQIQFGLKVTF